MDKKAKKILFQTYWKNGWIDRKDRNVNLIDLAYAKDKGLMFEPLTITHNDCIKQIIELSNNISIEKVAKSFLSSLSTRRLDWRSSIASYHIAKLLTYHKFSPEVLARSYKNGKISHTSYTCGVCKRTKHGVRGSENYENNDLNVLNFERIKWGGVRHGDLIYTLFDLEQFAKEQISEPTKEDVEILKAILNTINLCKQGDFPSILRDKLKEILNLKSTKDERSGILEILACIDILKPGSFDRPTSSKHDWTYVEFWRGEDGYNQELVDKYFKMYLNK